jgi:hypothetical protein
VQRCEVEHLCEIRRGGMILHETPQSCIESLEDQEETTWRDLRQREVRIASRQVAILVIRGVEGFETL